MTDLMYRQSKLSLRAWRSVLGDTTGSDERFLRRTQEAGDDFQREVFGLLYAPQDEANVVEKPAKWAQDTVAEMRSMPEWADLVASCVGRRNVADTVSRRLCVGIDGADKRGTADQKREDAKNVLRAAEAIDDPAEKAAAVQMARALLRESEIERGVSDRRPTLGARLAVEEAAKECAGILMAAEVLGGLGADLSPGTVFRVDDIPPDVLARVGASDWLRDLLGVLGRLRDAQRAFRATKTTGGRLDVVGITLGDELPKATTSELAKLNGPLRLDTIRRTVDGALFSREQRDEKPDDRGPFSILMDRSGSMAHNDRHKLTRAIAMALAIDALRDGRAVQAIAFDSGVACHRVLLPRTDTATTMSAMLDVFGIGPGGGTSIGPALACVDDERSGPRWDVAVLTDGVWSDPPAEMQKRWTTEGCVHEVRIGEGGPPKTWTTTTTFVADGDIGAAVRSLETIKNTKEVRR